MEEVRFDKYTGLGVYLILASFGILSILVVAYPYELRGVDTNVVYTVQQILTDNGNLYLSPETPPFSITQYGPVMYVIYDGLVSAFPFSVDDPIILLRCLRGISGLVLLLGLWQYWQLLVRDMKLRVELATLLIAFFFVGSFPWYLMSRPDVFVFLLLTLFLRCFLYRDDNYSQAILLGIITAVGIACKLNFAIFGLLTAALLVWERRYRRFWVFAAAAVLAGLLGWGLLEALGYDTQFIYENNILGVDNGIDIRRATDLVYLPFLVVVVPLLVLGSYLLWRATIDGVNSPITIAKKLSWFVAGSLCFALVTALKVGSAVNYLNEGFLILLIWVGYLITRTSQRSVAVAVVALLFFQVTTLHAYTHAPRLIGQNYVHALGGSLQIDRDRNAVIAFLKSVDSWNSFYSSDKLIGLHFPHRALLFQSDIHNLTFARNTYEYRRVHEMVSRGSIDYLVLDNNQQEFFGHRVRDAFVPVRSEGAFTIYRHK